MPRFYLWFGVFLAVALYLSALFAHEAPSGWTYPIACCSEKDCYRIDESEVRPAQGGGYRLVRTGEVFREPGAIGAASGERVFTWSGDQDFHRCSPEGKITDATSLCLLVPKPGV